MPPPPDDQILYAAVFAIGMASLATWIYVGTTLLRRGMVLPYEPRRPVPWGAVGSLLALLFVLASVSSAFSPERTRHEDDKPEGNDLVIDIAADAALKVTLVGTCVLAIVVVSQATARDFGLPASFGEACRDVLTGVLACLAAYIPVIIVRAVTVLLLGVPEDHPMIELVKQDPNGLMFAMATFAAVVVAPISEELSFRLLLQGWLEKWEDQRRISNNHVQTTTDECGMANGEVVENDRLSVVAPHTPLLPRGWLPILISSAMFAAAHIGNSTDPFPLFVLAIFLGIIYQRTHRILPSIVAHATFNFISMLVLWRMIFGPATG